MPETNSALPAGHWAERADSRKNIFKRKTNLPVMTLSLTEQTLTNITPAEKNRLTWEKEPAHHPLPPRGVQRLALQQHLLILFLANVQCLLDQSDFVLGSKARCWVPRHFGGLKHEFGWICLVKTCFPWLFVSYCFRRTSVIIVDTHLEHQTFSKCASTHA